MSKKKEIKLPCPKCKSTDIDITDDIEYGVGGYYCRCNSCGYAQKGSFSSEDDAIKSWNKKKDGVIKLTHYDADEIIKFMRSENLNFDDVVKDILFHSKNDVFALYENKEIVAIVMFNIFRVFPDKNIPNGKVGCMSGLYVKEEVKNKRYDTILKEHVKRIAEKENVDCIICKSDSDGVFNNLYWL